MLLLSIALKMEWQMVGGFGPQSMPEADLISKPSPIFLHWV